MHSMILKEVSTNYWTIV